MLVLEFKTYGKSSQFQAVDDAIRTAQFVRNSCIRLWMDIKGTGQNNLQKYCAVLAKNFPFANELNSQARQASAERAWTSINRFFENCKKGIPGQKGFPKFQKDCRSVEYKTSGWKLADDCKSITFTDKKHIGCLKLKGTRDLGFYSIDQIKRVRLVKRADGVYVQFCVNVNRSEVLEPSGNTIGLDVGLKEYYADSEGVMIENPKFLRKGEVVLKRSQRRVSHKVKGSNNRRKARQVLGKHHLKISRQRKDHAIKLARCVITIAVNPQYTSQECSRCGEIVKKALSTRTHVCQCGCVLDRDHNAARNILSRGLGTVGHTGTFGLEPSNASGDESSTQVGAILSEQVIS